jgi:hypothetical protein
MAWCEKERWGGGFLHEVVLLVSAMGLSEEGTAADGGESGWAGAGGVERGLLAALRRGEEVVFADEMRVGMLRQVRRVWGERGREVERACRTEVRVGVFGVGRGCDAGSG